MFVSDRVDGAIYVARHRTRGGKLLIWTRALRRMARRSSRRESQVLLAQNLRPQLSDTSAAAFMKISRGPKMRALFALVCLTIPTQAFACDLDDMVGWTLIARKTIEGRIDKGVRKDDFEGCDYDRIIVFDDNTGVRCAGYSYTYSYRPTAYVWANRSSLKMCVESSWFSVSRLRP